MVSDTYDQVVASYGSARRSSGPTRRASSLPLIARRVAAVAEAARAGDEILVRAELRELAVEANLLACAEPLPIAGVGRRQMIACGRDASEV